jgi:AcrR family transcriptional regulator
MPVNRENLLAGAAQILDEVGTYDGLTIDALASSLKMSKSTLYKHFESKDQLVDALVTHLAAQSAQDLARTVPRQGPPVEALGAFFDAYARHADRIPSALLLQPEKMPRGCRVRLEEVRRNLMASALEIIERGAASGAFQVQSGRAAGHAVACGLESAVLSCARREIPGQRSEVVRGMQQMFARGLGLPQNVYATA